MTASVGAVDRIVVVIVGGVNVDTKFRDTDSVTVVTGNFLVTLSTVAGTGLCIDQ